MLAKQNPEALKDRIGFNITEYRDTTTPIDTRLTFPLAAMIAEYQKSALVPRQQIACDVAFIEHYNRQGE